MVFENLHFCLYLLHAIDEVVGRGLFLLEENAFEVGSKVQYIFVYGFDLGLDLHLDVLEDEEDLTLNDLSDVLLLLEQVGATQSGSCARELTRHAIFKFGYSIA